MHGPIYWAPDVAASEAKGHPIFASLLHAGPWSYASHPQGGTLAFWTDTGRSLVDFHDPREISPGLHYHAPKTLPDFYGLARPGTKGGTDVLLACGIQATIPVALIKHRQLRLSQSAERFGDPVTEYGRLACRLLEHAKVHDGVANDSPDLLRLLALAFSQRYRITDDLLDDMQILAIEDTDQLLGAIWFGDPKALAPVSDGAINASATSVSTGAK